ncbi:hypothetical protein DRW41_13280 [Neobacillus piezotolerans]|uniref:Uncharacterized protein n=1 Tax=Neobacillus piezotolerans TaxID=2259171 RepID=A0A3D8GQ95_9BACI|nr:hypothetical protein [Neobacillus piezotolerans]RDU36497.1 hypothetical protein DRW41_13280 [Neobacillus piezotolerans]
MIDLLAELYDMNAWTALYTGIYLGIALKLLIDMGTEISFAEIEKQETGLSALNLTTIQDKNLSQNVNSILVWIGKYIRIKYGSHDDSEDAHFLPAS